MPTFKPHQYQQHAIDFVLRRLFVERELGAGLFLDPGLGKTGCTLSVLHTMQQLGDLRRALIVAPIRVCRNVWPAEVRKWGFNLGCSLIHGTPTQRERCLQANHPIHLINPEGVDWLVRQAKNFDRTKYCTLILDESTKFKNFTAKRTKALRSLLPAINRRIILTGTPSPNSFADLFSQIFILDDGRALGRTLGDFRREYCRPPTFRQRSWEFRGDRRAALEEAIKDMVLRLDAADHLDLPGIHTNDVWVHLPANARRHYDEIEKTLLTELDSGQTLTASSAGAVYAKCKQIANGGGYDSDGESVCVHDAKAEAIADLVEELGGKPVLVAYQYRHDLERLRATLGSVPAIAGGTPPRETDDLLDRWNRGEIPVLCAQPLAMSHGLNMQAGGCNHIIWMGLTDSLETYDQFNARVYRQGVQGRVIIHRILTAGTVDEVIAERLSGKSEDQKSLLESLRAYAAKRQRILCEEDRS